MPAIDRLVSLFEHNLWANAQLLEACAALTEEQLEASPDALSEWTVRHTLLHLVQAQQAYVELLTLPPEARQSRVSVPFGELGDSANRSGEALLALARDDEGACPLQTIHTGDGHAVEPWVILLQSINHATDHRRQVCGMLRALGVPAPRLDGWAFGGARGALEPPLT